MQNGFIHSRMPHLYQLWDFDFDGDNQHEIVLRGQQELHIINGSDGQNIFRDSCFSITNDERIVIADLDNDGHAELATGCNGDIVVYEGRDIEWSYTRPVFNQYLLHHMNINDDLTIPAYAQQQHLPHPNRHLNTYMVQYSIPVIRDIAEYQVQLDTVFCENGMTKLNIEICELNNFIQDSLFISIYSNDPTIQGSQLLYSDKIELKFTGQSMRNLSDRINTRN